MSAAASRPGQFIVHQKIFAQPFRFRFRLRLEGRNRWESRDGLRHQDKRSQAMSTAVTLINVFTAKPGKQQELARTLAEGTRNFFSKQPGSLSSSVVVGGDGSKVANISQWRSADDIAAFRADPRFADYMKSIVELAAGESMMGQTIYSHTGGIED
jgi:quinol monooxygenase YgiN